MIPTEVEEQLPPIPPRRTNPISFGLRWRRKRNLLLRQIKNLTFEYPTRVKFYAFVSIFFDYLLTSAGLNLIQRIHLSEIELTDPWQNAFPALLLAFIYIIPSIGILRQIHSFLLIYVMLTSMYLILAFIFTVRLAFNSHYGHYFYRVHYCSTKYSSSESVICIVSLLKVILFWPVFRCYMHARDCLEFRIAANFNENDETENIVHFSYYIRREDQNTYGIVDFDAISGSRSAIKIQSNCMKASSNIYTSEPHEQPEIAPIPLLDAFDSNSIHNIYENTNIQSSHSSSFASTLNGIPLFEYEDQSYMGDSEIQFVDGIEDDEYNDYCHTIEEETGGEELMVLQNQCFQP